MVSVASIFKQIFWRRRKVVPSCQGNAIAVDISERKFGHRGWQQWQCHSISISQSLIGEVRLVLYPMVISEKKLYMYIQPCSERRWFLERENILKRKIRAHLSKDRAGCCPGRPQGHKITQNNWHKISLVTSSIWGEHQCVFRTLVKQTNSLY